MQTPERTFYAYTYRDPRRGPFGEVFYVGKGCGRRAWAHWYGANKSNPHLNRRLAAIRADGLRPEISLIPVGSEAEAFELETALIALAGRRCSADGPLTNLSTGGDGPSAGAKRTPEQIERLAATTRGRKPAPQTIAAAVARHTGAKRSEQARANMRSAQQRIRESMTDTQRAKLSATMKAIAASRAAQRKEVTK